LYKSCLSLRGWLTFGDFSSRSSLPLPTKSPLPPLTASLVRQFDALGVPFSRPTSCLAATRPRRPLDPFNVPFCPFALAVSLENETVQHTQSCARRTGNQKLVSFPSTRLISHFIFAALYYTNHLRGVGAFVFCLFHTLNESRHKHRLMGELIVSFSSARRLGGSYEGSWFAFFLFASVPELDRVHCPARQIVPRAFPRRQLRSIAFVLFLCENFGG
jgi:hypothetical protein